MPCSGSPFLPSCHYTTLLYHYCTISINHHDGPFCHLPSAIRPPPWCTKPGSGSHKTACSARLEWRSFIQLQAGPSRTMDEMMVGRIKDKGRLVVLPTMAVYTFVFLFPTTQGSSLGQAHDYECHCRHRLVMTTRLQVLSGWLTRLVALLINQRGCLYTTCMYYGVWSMEYAVPYSVLA